jgi:hypothetical protein
MFGRKPRKTFMLAKNILIGKENVQDYCSDSYGRWELAHSEQADDSC